MVRYISLALEIVAGVGLPANGVTSPWRAGMEREEQFAEAIAEAQLSVNGARSSWYFMHTDTVGTPRHPFVSWQDAERSLVVVSVPCTTDDVFRYGEGTEGIDLLLSADGARGRIRWLVDNGHPVVLLTHWQSLFDDGSAVGLQRLDALLERIDRCLGDRVAWTTCSELAAAAVGADRGEG